MAKNKSKVSPEKTLKRYFILICIISIMVGFNVNIIAGSIVFIIGMIIHYYYSKNHGVDLKKDKKSEKSLGSKVVIFSLSLIGLVLIILFLVGFLIGLTPSTSDESNLTDSEKQCETECINLEDCYYYDYDSQFEKCIFYDENESLIKTE